MREYVGLHTSAANITLYRAILGCWRDGSVFVETNVARDAVSIWGRLAGRDLIVICGMYCFVITLDERWCVCVLVCVCVGVCV